MAVLICVIMVSFLKIQIILSSLAPGTPFKAFDCSKTDNSIKSCWLYDVNQCGDFKGFYEPPVRESIQVIKKLNTIDVVVYECEIKVSTHSQYCGGLSGKINFGARYQLTEDQPYHYTEEQCLQLVNNKIAYIDGIEHEVLNLDHFSFDYMISGSRDTKGNK